MKSTFSDDTWQAKRSLITRLYRDEEWPLKQVLKVIHTRDFRPSESQLRSRLKRWHVTKPSRKKYNKQRPGRSRKNGSSKESFPEDPSSLNHAALNISESLPEVSFTEPDTRGPFDSIVWEQSAVGEQVLNKLRHCPSPEDPQPIPMPTPPYQTSFLQAPKGFSNYERTKARHSISQQPKVLNHEDNDIVTPSSSGHPDNCFGFPPLADHCYDEECLSGSHPEMDIPFQLHPRQSELSSVGQPVQANPMAPLGQGKEQHKEALEKTAELQQPSFPEDDLIPIWSGILDTLVPNFPCSQLPDPGWGEIPDPLSCVWPTLLDHANWPPPSRW